MISNKNSPAFNIIITILLKLYLQRSTKLDFGKEEKVFSNNSSQTYKSPQAFGYASVSHYVNNQPCSGREPQRYSCLHCKSDLCNSLEKYSINTDYNERFTGFRTDWYGYKAIKLD